MKVTKYILILFLIFAFLFTISVWLWYRLTRKPFASVPPLITYRISASDSINPNGTFLYNLDNFQNPKHLSQEEAHSGENSTFVDAKTHTSVVIQKPVSELILVGSLKINFGALLKTKDKTFVSGKLVLQLVSKFNVLKHNAEVNISEFINQEEWTQISGSTTIPGDKIKKSDIIKLYYKSNSVAKVYLDDLTIIITPTDDKEKETDTLKNVSAMQPPLPVVFSNFKAEISGYSENDTLSGFKIQEKDKLIAGHFFINERQQQILIIRQNKPIGIINLKKEPLNTKIYYSPLTEDISLENYTVLTGTFSRPGQIINIESNTGNISCYSYDKSKNNFRKKISSKIPITSRILSLESTFLPGHKSNLIWVVTQNLCLYKGIIDNDSIVFVDYGIIEKIQHLNFNIRTLAIPPSNTEKANILVIAESKQDKSRYYGYYEISLQQTKIITLSKGSFVNNNNSLQKLEIFPLTKNGINTNSAIFFSLDKRFEMKLVRFYKKGFHEIAGIDFKGYFNNYNPKYYELIKIVPGQFLPENQELLFIIASNHCQSEVLPAKSELYSLEEILGYEEK